jgi:hypothetical protein
MTIGRFGDPDPEPYFELLKKCRLEVAQVIYFFPPRIFCSPPIFERNVGVGVGVGVDLGVWIYVCICTYTHAYSHTHGRRWVGRRGSCSSQWECLAISKRLSHVAALACVLALASSARAPLMPSNPVKLDESSFPPPPQTLLPLWRMTDQPLSST